MATAMSEANVPTMTSMFVILMPLSSRSICGNEAILRCRPKAQRIATHAERQQVDPTA
jgi:hypothetical protein